MTIITPTRAAAEPKADWELAGEAWSHAPADWAYSFEPYARDAIEEVFRATAVGVGTRVLDVACGSGLAMARAERLGAETAGLDAALGLLEIAERRAPAGELVHGTMFDLPWADESFDVVVAFNGIWGGCEAAVAEIARVCRPGGRVGITFWGRPTHLDLLGYFVTLGSADDRTGEEITSLAGISEPGVAEEMLSAAGFGSIERGSTSSVLELPDAETAWRALRSPGLTVPALRHVGEDALRAQVLTAIEPFQASDGSYRMTNELIHVVAQRES
jgi:SAM-dependent methyltransferase